MKLEEFTSTDYAGEKRRFRVNLADRVHIGDRIFFKAAEMCIEKYTGLSVEKEWKYFEPAAITDNGRQKFICYVTQFENGYCIASTVYSPELVGQLQQHGVRVVNNSGMKDEEERFTLEAALSKFQGRDRRSLALLVTFSVSGVPIVRGKDDIYYLNGSPVSLSFLGYGPGHVEKVLTFARKSLSSSEQDNLLKLLLKEVSFK